MGIKRRPDFPTAPNAESPLADLVFEEARQLIGREHLRRPGGALLELGGGLSIPRVFEIVTQRPQEVRVAVTRDFPIRRSGKHDWRGAGVDFTLRETFREGDVPEFRDFMHEAQLKFRSEF